MNFLKLLNINLATPIKEVEGYEKLQARINEKSEFLEKVFNSFNELNKYLKEIFKKLLSLNSNFTAINFSFEEQNIQESLKLIYQKIINNVQQDNRLVLDILKNLGGHINAFTKEKALYDDFKKLNKELQEEKEKLKKNKEIYHIAGKDAENKIKKFIETNYQNLYNLSEDLKKELDNITLPPIKAYTNYKSSFIRVNELKTKFNNKQKIIFQYLPELGNEDGVFFFRLIKLYLQNLENGERYLNLNKKQLNESKAVETNSKLKELIENNENNKIDEKQIDLIQYQSELDFNKCKDKAEFDLFAKTKEMINQRISSDIFPYYNYENDYKNYEEGKLIKELFEEENLDEKKAQKFLDSLKDKSLHRGIYIILSQLRTNSRFQRSKPLIELIGKAFGILLEYAEKNKLYDDAKDCIILSQTYYYNDDKNKKIYLFELIKNNKWLTNPQFWRDFIDYNLKNEFQRFEKYFYDTNFNVELNINLTDKVKNKLNEVVFSQLLTYISNMVDFEIDKRIVLKITDEFKEKYNYLSPSNLDTLYQMISKNKEEIETLRKEYNPSLESELISNKNENKKEELKENIENKENSQGTREGKKENISKEESKETEYIKEDNETIKNKLKSKDNKEDDKVENNKNN